MGYIGGCDNFESGEGGEVVAGDILTMSLIYDDDVNQIIKLPVVGAIQIASLVPSGGLWQEQGVDFTIRTVAGCNNSVNDGNYIILALDSAAPDGGFFNNGSNPAKGVIPPLEKGDEVFITYFKK